MSRSVKNEKMRRVPYCARLPKYLLDELRAVKGMSQSLVIENALVMYMSKSYPGFKKVKADAEKEKSKHINILTECPL